MIVAKPPQAVPEGKASVFLAGTIDMGNSVDWQAQFTETLKAHDVVVMNPRRDDWDSSWEQDINNPEFKQQVTWELDGLESATFKVFYFAPGSKSPVTMMELGLMSSCFNGINVLVVCPEGFWRKGNVDIFSERNGFMMFDSLEDASVFLKRMLPLDLGKA